MSQFTIVLFDDGLQLVPSSWLFEDKTMCYWPPYKNEKKLHKAIEETVSPEGTWTTHKILRIFGTSSTYESGIEKVKLAQDYSNLDISDIDNSRSKRISRPKKIFTNYDYSSSASDDSDQNNNTISEKSEAKKTLSSPPSLPKSFIVNDKPNNEKIVSKECYPNSSRNIIKETSVTLDTPGKNMLSEILRRLNQIMAKLNSIDDRLCKLEENQNNVQRNKEMLVLQEFINLPLKTKEEVNNMEKDLENQNFFEEMAISLNRIGGRDSRELITNILKRTITNEIAMQYSWAGKLKKVGFKDLLLAKCIMRAVRITDDKVTEKEIMLYFQMACASYFKTRALS